MARIIDDTKINHPNIIIEEVEDNANHGPNVDTSVNNRAVTRYTTQHNQVARRRRNNNNRKNNNRGNATQLMRLEQVMSGTQLHQYAEAVCNPFSAKGLYCIRPGKYSENVLPACDRHEYNIQPSKFDSDTYGKICGFAVAFLPRCNRLWMNSTLVGSNSGDVHRVAVPWTNYTSELIPTFPADDNDPTFTAVWSNAYYSCFIPITCDGWAVRNTSPGEQPDNPDLLQLGPMFVETSRYPNLRSTCVSTQINSAGIRLLPTEAPINTGGTVYAGVMTMSDLYNLYSKQEGEFYSGSQTGPFKTLEKYIKYRNNFQGIKGACARYCPFTDQEPQDKRTSIYDLYGVITTGQGTTQNIAWISGLDKVANVKRSLVNEKDDTKSDVEPTLKDKYNKTSINNTNYVLPSWPGSKKDNKVKGPSSTLSGLGMLNQIDIGVHDMCDVDQLIPMIYYKFNVDSTTGEPAPYNLEYNAQIHVQNIPVGDNPFATKSNHPDMALEAIESALVDPSCAPFSATGHSFNKFFKKLMKFAAKVAKYAGPVGKIAGIVAEMLL